MTTELCKHWRARFTFYSENLPLTQSLLHRRTNPGRQDAQTNKFDTVAPKVCRSSIWNFTHANLLAPRILRWLLNFENLCTPGLLYVLTAETFRKTNFFLHLVYGSENKQ